MLKEVNWSESRDYKTGGENEPLQFYLDSLCNSTSFDLLLGYFSSTAINVLSLGFANFLYGGGKMRMVINNVLSEQDKEAIQKGQNENITIRNFNLNDIKSIKDSLDAYGRHFFECLAWLISQEKIEIKIIKPKDGKGISHYKSGVFSDGSNFVGFKASCNFTAFGLLENLEELDCFLTWENGRSNKWIKSQKDYFQEIFEEKADFVEYLNVADVLIAIKSEFGNKTIDELLLNEKELLGKKKLIPKNENLEASIEKANSLIEEHENEERKPRFPFPQGAREYQRIAYKNWVENDRKGLFAMATGTGKTITSLNCIVEDYKINNYYKFIVLVPTISLASQWEKEITKKFNFEEITVCSSANNGWEDKVRNYGKNLKLGIDTDFCILTTYATFRGDRFQRVLKDLFTDELKNITLIADEAHTLGSTELLKVLPLGIEKRIGLSATPERQFDIIGELELGKFFKAEGPCYTFNYNMKKAIEAEVLCKYYYYPIIVELEADELIEYKEITKKLIKFLDPNTGRYKEDPYVNNLLIKRKNIIHKARRKSKCLTDIIDKIGKDNFNYAFIYVPEGYETNYEENDLDQNQDDDEKIINEYTKLLYDKYQFKLKKFTGDTKNRDEILQNFSEGKLDALLAMKCLDEGVDIPQTKYAIFCSSTGNPRQYIQRRGRVLRFHGKKEFAYIYDMIVKPSLEITNTDLTQVKLEKNIFKSELTRVVNFAVLAENKIDVLKELEELCTNFDIDIYDLANIEDEKYNLCDL
jgi:superfamily II DNA or RNA helicase